MGDSVLATSSIICLFKMQCGVSENPLCGGGGGWGEWVPAVLCAEEPNVLGGTALAWSPTPAGLGTNFLLLPQNPRPVRDRPLLMCVPKYNHPQAHLEKN